MRTSGRVAYSHVSMADNSVSNVIPIGPPKSNISARAKIVDEYGEVTRRLALCAPDEQMEKLLRDKINGWFENDPREGPLTANGRKWQVQLSAKRNQRTFSDKKKAFNLLRKRLGFDGLIAVLDIPLGVLDKNASDSERACFLVEERSGSRTLSVVPLGPVDITASAGRKAA